MSDFDEKDIHKDVTSDFAPEDIAPQKMGAAEAGLLGAEQGLTLGTSDEMSGGVGAGLDATQELLNKLGLSGPSVSQTNKKLSDAGIKGDIGPQSTLDLYKQMRDAERAKIDKAQTDQPAASIAGNIAGGLLLAPAAAALTPIKVGANAGRMAKIGAGAYNAAALGGLSELGTSKATSPDELTDDVINSAKTGGIIGAAIPAASGAISAGGKAIAGTQKYQDILAALKAGKEGINQASPEFLKTARGQLKDMAQSAANAFRQKNDNIFEAKSKILNDLEKTGIKSDTSEVLKNLADTIGNSPGMTDDELKVINNTLASNMQSGYSKSPLELEKLLKDLKDLKGNVRTNSGYKAIDDAIQNVRNIQSKLSTEIGHLNNQAFQTVESGSVLTGMSPLEYGEGTDVQAMKKRIANVLENQADYKVGSELDDVLKGKLTTTKNAKISPLSELVPDAASAIESSKPIANNMRIAKQMQGPVFAGKNIFESGANALTSGGTNMANKAGLAVKTSQDFLKSGTDYLSKMDANALNGLGAKMVQAGGEVGKQFANVLQNATTKNPQSKNAIIFSLMQQPQFRELYHKVNGNEVPNTDFDKSDIGGADGQ